MQDLLNNPPTAGEADPAFAGRDWQHIGVGELVNSKDLLFVELDTSVEAATNVGDRVGRCESRAECLICAIASDRIRRACAPGAVRSDGEIGRRHFRLP